MNGHAKVGASKGLKSEKVVPKEEQLSLKIHDLHTLKKSLIPLNFKN